MVYYTYLAPEYLEREWHFLLYLGSLYLDLYQMNPTNDISLWIDYDIYIAL